MLASAAVLSLLATSWWLALTLLGRTQGAPAARLDRLIDAWPGQPPPGSIAKLLATNDLPALEAAYQELKAKPGTMSEALVSLALAEAQGDVVKAQRGLEAVRLMLDDPERTSAERECQVLDMLEARLRLVLAEAGSDPRQRELARAALERKPSATGRSAG